MDRTIQRKPKPLPIPYPYFGSKRRIAGVIWERLGDVPNYVEPFFGSGAVLLARPHQPRTETINDINAFLCNFWRAVKADPKAVAEAADFPVNETHLHSVHRWLVFNVTEEGLRARLEADPAYYDPEAAGCWAWGASLWIGRDWCPRKEPARQVPNLGDTRGLDRASYRTRPEQGRRPHLTNRAGKGQGGYVGRSARLDYLEALTARLAHVRVCCGDWTRVLGPTPTTQHGLTAVFLDPPYDPVTGRDSALYVHEGSSDLSARVREWAIAHGTDPQMRICLAGYEGEHSMPPEWTCLAWKAKAGFCNQGSGASAANRDRERLWFSPGCLAPEAERYPLFARLEAEAIDQAEEAADLAPALVEAAPALVEALAPEAEAEDMRWCQP